MSLPPHMRCPLRLMQGRTKHTDIPIHIALEELQGRVLFRTQVEASTLLPPLTYIDLNSQEVFTREQDHEYGLITKVIRSETCKLLMEVDIRNDDELHSSFFSLLRRYTAIVYLRPTPTSGDYTYDRRLRLILCVETDDFQVCIIDAELEMALEYIILREIHLGTEKWYSQGARSRSTPSSPIRLTLARSNSAYCLSAPHYEVLYHRWP
ncbi:hypothetical protein HPP92_028955 [Vanilla planifolia]|uniref:Uncharacterized protein n=1 Tax=Vanilla planifolia TaxID=51239 RepID=A0A835U292_VANPL|nr:hypothetical protein HPP92_028944 [Vanilla planifolia]KAG0446213.1 hypothetical protein HPP92_028955 [Vanilla planifolia]